MERVGIERELAEDVFDAFNDIIMEIIATEDYVQLTWARVEGYCKEPVKIHGYYSETDTAKANRGWSWAKCGFPKITFTNQAKDCTVVSPEEYFNDWIENRYTTKASEFRKDAGLPEIEEYAILTESQIKKVQKLADEKRYGKKTKKQQLEDARWRQANARSALIRAHIRKMDYIEQKVAEGVPREVAEKVPLAVIMKEDRKEWRNSMVEKAQREAEYNETNYWSAEALKLKKQLKAKELNNHDYQDMTDEEILEWEQANSFDQEDLNALDELRYKQAEAKDRILSEYIAIAPEDESIEAKEKRAKLSEEALNALLQKLEEDDHNPYYFVDDLKEVDLYSDDDEEDNLGSLEDSEPGED